MTSFGWKRKIGEKFSKESSKAFDANAADEEDESIRSGEVDWLHLVPKRRAMQLEDGISKAKRLRDEGGILAEQERSWEALQKWDESIVYNPGDEAVYEMKAQAYMQVGEVLPAIQAAKKSVSIKPRWWVAHQTLGRAFLGVGEVKQALNSFCKALHINPASDELWQDDFKWTLDLYKQSTKVKEEKKRKKELEQAAKIVELDEEGYCKDVVRSTDSSKKTEVVGESYEAKTGYIEGHILAKPDGEPGPTQRQKARRKAPRQGSSLPSSYVCLRE